MNCILVDQLSCPPALPQGIKSGTTSCQQDKGECDPSQCHAERSKAESKHFYLAARQHDAERQLIRRRWQALNAERLQQLGQQIGEGDADDETDDDLCEVG